MEDGRANRWMGSDRHGVCPYMRACSPNWRGGKQENRLRECPHQYGLSLETIFAADAYYSRSQKVVFGYRNTLRQESEGLFTSIIYYFESQKVFWCRNMLQQEPRNHFWCRRTLFRDLNSFPAHAEHYAKT